MANEREAGGILALGSAIGARARCRNIFLKIYG